ncbi:MAG: hypothetical protein K2M46_14465 [Lachnospiraceae bacterium]|nr:hypothetical protein [Lachnospiraceae bacterium]
MTIKEIRQLTSLSQKKFCEKYGIPLQTLCKWEQGYRTCPDYVAELLEFKVREDIGMYMDGGVKKFINPCKMYAKIKSNNEIIHINGYKVELDTVILYSGSSSSGYKEEHFMLDEVDIFEYK